MDYKERVIEILQKIHKEKIRYVMIGLQMGEAVRAGKTA